MLIKISVASLVCIIVYSACSEVADRFYGVSRMDALKGSTNRGMVREMGEVVR
jgi:hypothetical protein